MHTGSEALPGDFTEIVVDAADDPNIPTPSAERRGCTIAEEIKTADAHLTLKRVLIRNGDAVDDVWRFSRQWKTSPWVTSGFAPAGWSASGQRLQINRLALGHLRTHLLFTGCVAVPIADVKLLRRLSGQVQQELPIFDLQFRLFSLRRQCQSA